MTLRISVEIFERNFKAFMEEWEEWDERIIKHDKSDSILSAYNVFIKTWRLWFERLTKLKDEDAQKLFRSCEELKPAFHRILPIFKAFQAKWISFNEKYEPVFKNVSEQHAALYKKINQVIDNVDAACK